MTALRDDALTGRVVLVSGGTQGIGAAVAARAARCGAEAVVVTGRRREPGEALAAALSAEGVPSLFVRTDVADPAEASDSVARTIAAFGRIDAVVNAAGLTDRGSLLDTTPELFDRQIAVNLRGPFFVMQAAVRDMLARGAAGSIVNVGSISAHAGQSFLAPYVAAKGGLAALTRNAAHAHRRERIRINGLNIGWTATEGEDRTQRAFHAADDTWLDQAARSVPAGRLGDPDQIADMIVFLLSDASGLVTGSVIDWDQLVVGAVD